jgi:hypothetical protein
MLTEKLKGRFIVKGINFTDSDLMSLVVLQELVGLDLSGAHDISVLGFDALTKLHELRELNLAGCENVTDKELAMVSRISGLESLDLSLCHKISRFVGLPYMWFLREFYFFDYVHQELIGFSRLFVATKNDLTSELFSQNNRNMAMAASDPIITRSIIPPRKK